MPLQISTVFLFSSVSAPVLPWFYLSGCKNCSVWKVPSDTNVEKTVWTLMCMILSPAFNWLLNLYLYLHPLSLTWLFITNYRCHFICKDCSLYLYMIGLFLQKKKKKITIGRHFNKDCYSKWGVWFWANYLISLILMLLIRWQYLLSGIFWKLAVNKIPSTGLATLQGLRNY